MMFPSRPIQRILGAGLAIGAAGLSFAQNPVFFQVDMNSQPTAASVYVRGGFNGWGTGNQLDNNGSGVYTGTVDIAASPGSVQACKFFYQPGDNWESIADRQFVLAGGAQTQPLTSWNVSDWPVPVNNVKFQVDMSAQILLHKFTNGAAGSYVRVSGGFNGWSGSMDFTNNPSASGLASNIYCQTLPISGFPGSYPGNYKFRAPIGDTWETISDRSSFQLTGGDQTLPLVFWDNASVCDLLQQDTTVTFVLHMTNGTPDRYGTPFNSGADSLYINGAFLGWWAWYDGITGAQGPQNQLTNNPIGSDYYQQTFTIGTGSPLATKFKFSINGYDNEAGFAVDHVRYIRTTGSSYIFPASDFGTNFLATLVEQSFGDLRIAAPSGGSVPVTWLGRQCVTLQTKSAVPSGSWTDLPATDGTSATNWPNGGGNQFFRLQKRNNP